MCAATRDARRRSKERRPWLTRPPSADASARPGSGSRRTRPRSPNSRPSRVRRTASAGCASPTGTSTRTRCARRPGQEGGRGRGGRAGARRGADQEAHHPRAKGSHAGGRRAGRRRIVRPPLLQPRAPGASPGPFSVRSRRWPRSCSPRHVGQRGRPRANLTGSAISDRDNSRNPAEGTQSRGALPRTPRAPRGYPTPLHSYAVSVALHPPSPQRVARPRAELRVARSAEHAQVGAVERRAARAEGHDVVHGQGGRGVGGMLGPVPGAPPPVLPDVGCEHALADPPPRPRPVEGVGVAAGGPGGVGGAAAPGSAGDDAADRAELHRPKREPG